ncbi:hypothetical protein E2C01_075403 [Portunus trituberculatus]|uniref:Uncharacterized protein n=1 Tax=Portunus trituberculatus TaxID=210409 RepID=A0A5B7I8G8_PORTR|nr:hypothetical protein [Portunus trituberculatus]
MDLKFHVSVPVTSGLLKILMHFGHPHLI